MPEEYKKEGLPCFPGSVPLKTKKGARTSWDLGGTRPNDDPGSKVPKGWWGEWDSKRGEVEVYNKKGKHQGAYDPETGRLRPRSQDPDKNPTYSRFDAWEATPQSEYYPAASTVKPNPVVWGTGTVLTFITFLFMLARG